jgi:hypothetical protein
VPTPGALEVPLPTGAVIDLTTYGTFNERSRLPIDPNTNYVDILLNQAGQVVPTTTYSNPGSMPMGAAFYHFWIADRSDVYAPSGSTTVQPQLPIPAPPGTITYPGVGQTLKKDRQLLTLFTRTGQILTNSIENFDYANAYGLTTTPYDVSAPFYQAQLGIREAK